MFRLGVGAPLPKEGEEKSHSTHIANNDRLKRQLLGADYKKMQERQAETSENFRVGGSQVSSGSKRARLGNGDRVAGNSHGSRSTVSRSAHDDDSDDEPGRSSLGKSRSLFQ